MLRKFTLAILVFLASIFNADAQLTKIDNPVKRSSLNAYLKSSLYNFGLGTTSPDSNYILDANGNIRISGMDGITGPWGTYVDFVNGGADTIRIGGGTNVTYLEVRNTNNESLFLYHDGANGVIESSLGFTKINDVLILSTLSKTIASDGTGAAAASTLTIANSTGRTINPVTCSDGDGCTLTLSETNAVSGMKVVVIALSTTNPLTMSTSTGVQELKGDWQGLQYDSIEFQYQSSTWVETSRSSRYDWVGNSSGISPRSTSYKVGIGNSAPSTNLHVTGNIRVTGLSSCDTIDTDSNGNFSCGTDATGGAAPVGFAFVFSPEQAKLPTSNTMEITAAGGRWSGLYDATTEECAQWESYLRPYQSGSLKIKIAYSMVSAQSSTVQAFNVYLMCVSSGDALNIDTDDFDSTNAIASSSNSLGVGRLNVLSATLSNVDSCALDDLMIVKICRDATGSDTGTGDLQLRKVEIYE